MFDLMSGQCNQDTWRIIVLPSGETPFLIQHEKQVIWQGELPEWKKDSRSIVPTILAEQVTKGYGHWTTLRVEPLKLSVPSSLNSLKDVIESHLKENPNFVV